MHKDHNVFIQGMEQEKRLELTFFSAKHSREVVSLCAPLHYSKGPASPARSEGDELECYYLWDFGAKNDSNFLALSPSQIISMKPTDEVFHVQEFYGLNKQAAKATKEQDVND